MQLHNKIGYRCHIMLSGPPRFIYCLNVLVWTAFWVYLENEVQAKAITDYTNINEWENTSCLLYTYHWLDHFK
jgi:hypothetical protein